MLFSLFIIPFFALSLAIEIYSLRSFFILLKSSSMPRITSYNVCYTKLLRIKLMLILDDKIFKIRDKSVSEISSRMITEIEMHVNGDSFMDYIS